MQFLLERLRSYVGLVLTVCGVVIGGTFFLGLIIALLMPVFMKALADPLESMYLKIFGVASLVGLAFLVGRKTNGELWDAQACIATIRTLARSQALVSSKQVKKEVRQERPKEETVMV